MSHFMSQLDDDSRSSEVVVIEDMDAGGHCQALSIRVGPVYYADGVPPGTGVWVCYQAEHLSSAPMGPVLIDPPTWKALSKAVSKRLRQRRRGWRNWHIISGRIARAGYSAQWLP
jgi:hypothetical protein